MAKLVLTVVMLQVFLFGVCFGELLTPEQLQKLDDYIQAVMSCRNVPGLTLAVVQGDDVFTRAYGKTDLEKDINATSDSIFCIGSLTKAMATTLLSKLVPPKFPKTVWDTKLTDILGESFNLDQEDFANTATLKDILCHRSGKAKGDVAIFAGFPYSLTRAQMAKRLHILPASKPFRYEWDYNNWMYFLAGHVAEVIADNGDTWEELMRKDIFRPLGMDSTIFLPEIKDQPEGKFALPYYYIDGSRYLLSLNAFRLHPAEPAGAVCSTGNDMANWLQFLLQTGSTKPLEEIVNATAFNDTMTPFQLRYSTVRSLFKPTYPIDYVEFGYGLGWITAFYRGRHQIVHSGGFFSHTSLLTLYPELKTGMFVNINGQNDGGDSKSVIFYYLADLLLGEEPWLNSTTACTFPEPWVKPPEHNATNSTRPSYESQRPLKDYVGIYGNQFFGDMHVSVNMEEEVLRVAFGRNLEGVLIPEDKKDVFSWNITSVMWFMSADQQTIHDRFQFYSSNGGTLDILNASIIGEFIHFDRNIRFDEISAGAVHIWPEWYSVTAVLTLFLLVNFVTKFGLT